MQGRPDQSVRYAEGVSSADKDVLARFSDAVLPVAIPILGRDVDFVWMVEPCSPGVPTDQTEGCGVLLISQSGERVFVDSMARLRVMGSGDFEQELRGRLLSPLTKAGPSD